MSYEDEISLQREDDEAYSRWFQETPEYWCELTDTLTAKVVASGGRDTYAASGEIEA